MRGATSLVLAARLEGEGAIVRAYDPVAMDRAAEEMPKVEMCDSALAALEGADAAVLVTEWPEFAELDWGDAAKRMARPLLVDGRNFLDADALRGAGFDYEGIGREVERLRRPSRTDLMQAIVLVGGEGTRLRPLTSTVPKPALTLVDRPFLAYMVEWLARHGVEEVVLACGFLPDVLREALGEGEHSGTRIRYVAEPEPLGTAGAIRFAADELGEELGERFLALNGDVLTDLDLTRCCAAHEARGARATLGLHPVEDSAAYGLVSRGADGAVLEFLEKTGEAAPGEVNAGMYVLERSVLDLIPPGADDLDRARGLPAAGRPGAPRRCCSRATGWTSAPRSATCRRPGTSSRAGSRPWSSRPAPGCYVDPTAEIAESAVVGPARRARAALPGRVRGGGPRIGPARGMRGRDGRQVSGSILAAGARVAPGAALDGAVVGSDERVPAETPERKRRRLIEGGQRCSTTSSPCPTTFATPSGASSPPGSRPPTRPGSSSAGWAARRSAATWPPRRSASASRGRWRRCAATACPPGPAPTGPCSAPATRAGPRRRSPASRRRPRRGARRIVAGTGGALVDRAREEGVPVVGLPGILQPRAAVAYMFVVAAEAAALAGAAPRIADRGRGRRRPARAARRGARGPRGGDRRAPGGHAARDLRRRADDAAGAALEDPDQREREAPGLLLRAARGRPQRDLRLGRAARGHAGSRSSCSRTPISTLACAAASS